MQQEVHSYAFQLRDDCISTSIAAHYRDPDFFTSIHHPQSSSTFLYRLRYNQANPRKSQLVYQVVPDCLVEAVYATSPFSAKGLLLSGRRKGEQRDSISLYKYENFEKEVGSTEVEEGKKEEKAVEEEVLFRTETESERVINLLTKKDQKTIFVGTNKQVEVLDAETLKSVQEGIKPGAVNEGWEGSEITHCVMDNIYEYLTYVTDSREITILDKAHCKQKYTFSVFSSKSATPCEPILSLGYNPNKQYHLMTAHHSMLKFWDIRKPSIPVRIFGQEHHHSLLLAACFNHSHDELVLGCYDDGTVGLSRVLSAASGPTTDFSAEMPSAASEDCLVKLYDEHEDSVYHACWAEHSPWVFGSVSYGAANLVINTVPSVEKYRILL